MYAKNMQFAKHKQSKKQADSQPWPILKQYHFLLNCCIMTVNRREVLLLAEAQSGRAKEK